jgi:hypothetical protein
VEEEDVERPGEELVKALELHQQKLVQELDANVMEAIAWTLSRRGIMHFQDEAAVHIMKGLKMVTKSGLESIYDEEGSVAGSKSDGDMGESGKGKGGEQDATASATLSATVSSSKCARTRPEGSDDRGGRGTSISAQPINIQKRDESVTVDVDRRSGLLVAAGRTRKGGHPTVKETKALMTKVFISGSRVFHVGNAM